MWVAWNPQLIQGHPTGHTLPGMSYRRFSRGDRNAAPITCEGYRWEPPVSLEPVDGQIKTWVSCSTLCSWISTFWGPIRPVTVPYLGGCVREGTVPQKLLVYFGHSRQHFTVGWRAQGFPFMATYKEMWKASFCVRAGFLHIHVQNTWNWLTGRK